ncbi:peptidase [Gammaproteobacteria bacterium 45_16_T64]|nr:peptidase [Gammaproteobacteria bacterium 45_16_T64]
MRTLLITLWFISSQSYADTLIITDDTSLTGSFTQGGLITGYTSPLNTISFNGEVLRTTPKGHFVFGFGRDAEATHTLSVTTPGGSNVEKIIQVSPRVYALQKVNGVPQKTVTPPKKAQQRIQKETALVKSARRTQSNATSFLEPFSWPLKGPITGVYGSQRVYNGTPKRPHFGLDIAAPVGTLVKAPADATVTLAHQNMYYSGGTLIMDHGYGISSTFIHLDEVLVNVGDKIKRGDNVAKVGSKGRSTGPHLDWRINWFHVRLDPALVVPPMEKK